MPEVGAHDYLIEWFFDVGPIESGSNGISAISYAEIYSWSRSTKTIITYWEAQTLRMMSRAYKIEFQDGSENPESPLERDTRSESEKIADSFKSYNENKRRG